MNERADMSRIHGYLAEIYWVGRFKHVRFLGLFTHYDIINDIHCPNTKLTAHCTNLEGVYR